MPVHLSTIGFLRTANSSGNQAKHALWISRFQPQTPKCAAAVHACPCLSIFPRLAWPERRERSVPPPLPTSILQIWHTRRHMGVRQARENAGPGQRGPPAQTQRQQHGGELPRTPSHPPTNTGWAAWLRMRRSAVAVSLKESPRLTHVRQPLEAAAFLEHARGFSIRRRSSQIHECPCRAPGSFLKRSAIRQRGTLPCRPPGGRRMIRGSIGAGAGVSHGPGGLAGLSQRPPRPGAPVGHPPGLGGEIDANWQVGRSG
jgi:hypothetical protein